MPLAENDIIRLLTEIMPKFSSENAIAEWLEREGISEEAFTSLGRDIYEIVSEDILSHIHDPGSGIQALVAGIQMAFFVGWECGKEYAHRRDMSQGGGS